MALSGLQNFSLTRDNLITMALQNVGAIGDGDTPNPTQLTECSLLLNALIKHWQIDNIELWIRKLGYILPVSATNKTALGAEGGHASNSYVYTTVGTAAVSGASTLILTTASGISNTNNIGIELADGTMQWTTVNGVPVGSTVTLTATLTQAVAAGNSVYSYATKILRPDTVLDAYRRVSSNTLANQTDVPLIKKTQQEYNNLASKFQLGIPNSYFYDEVLGFNTSGYPGNGDFYFWPLFSDGDSVIVIQYTKIFDNLDSASNNCEFPQAWFLPIMFGLSWLLAPKHGLPLDERSMLLKEMMLLKEAALERDQEFGSIYIQPNPEWRNKQ